MAHAAQITDLAELERALQADLYLLFKHSPVCPISTHALTEFDRFRSAHPTLPAGLLDVIGQRPLSEWVVAKTGVPHESPQAVLFQSGKPVWTASHGAITYQALEAALQSCRGAAP